MSNDSNTDRNTGGSAGVNSGIKNGVKNAKAPLRQKASRAPSVKPVSKEELRRELELATNSFLHDGGSVTEVPTGTSAWEPGTRPPPSRPLFTQPPTERTPLDDVVAALDSRRAEKRTRKSVRRTRKPSPRRRIIYDDFGEPLRKIWSDD